jgi:dTDP-4-dehydrorhamnose reductase
LANIESERILVTGARGQVGREFQEQARNHAPIEWRFPGKAELDIAEPGQIDRIFSDFKPTVCINCAAYTAVDRAESEPELAERINAAGPAHLADRCRTDGAFLVHLSSDYVYHNGLNRPLREDDPTLPQSVYARTKLAGDLQVLDYPHAFVIRSSWIFSPFGHNFVKTMRRLGAEREKLTIVWDQIGSPTYALDLVEGILSLLALPERPGGILNFSNEGVCSWYDFAFAIMEEEGLACEVTPVPTGMYPTAARRPPYSIMDKTRWKQLSGKPIPHWRTSLRHCLQRLRAEAEG